MIDETNAWFWRKGGENEAGALAKSLHGLHFYPTLAIIENVRRVNVKVA